MGKTNKQTTTTDGDLKFNFSVLTFLQVFFHGDGDFKGVNEKEFRSLFLIEFLSSHLYFICESPCKAISE